MVKCRTVDRRDGCSITHAAVSKLRQFHSFVRVFRNSETLKAGIVPSFYLVSMPGEEKDPPKKLQ